MELLKILGYTQILESYRTENQWQIFEVGRVIAEHKERYVVKTSKGDLDAEITGNLRFTAATREDFPAVGDWVALTVFDANQAIIHHVFPRHSVIKRQAAGHASETQLLAVNVDYALLVQAIDRDFNLNRLERYLTIAFASGVDPMIVLTKCDLITSDEKQQIIEQIKQRHPNLLVFALSNQTLDGFDALKNSIQAGKTYCLLGSSGVGKSTLLNNLMQSNSMKTHEISQSTNKGRHTTSHRELIVLPQGGILIDNPGLREVGIANAGQGLAATFDLIFDLAQQCKYSDCQHNNEKGCAVIAAVEKGQLAMDIYENYIKLEREKNHFAASEAERRQKDKALGKIVKDYYKKDVKKKYK